MSLSTLGKPPFYLNSKISCSSLIAYNFFFSSFSWAAFLFYPLTSSSSSESLSPTSFFFCSLDSFFSAFNKLPQFLGHSITFPFYSSSLKHASAASRSQLKKNLYNSTLRSLESYFQRGLLIELISNTFCKSIFFGLLSFFNFISTIFLFISSITFLFIKWSASSSALNLLSSSSVTDPCPCYWIWALFLTSIPVSICCFYLTFNSSR